MEMTVRKGMWSFTTTGGQGRRAQSRDARSARAWKRQIIRLCVMSTWRETAAACCPVVLPVSSFFSPCKAEWSPWSPQVSVEQTRCVSVPWTSRPPRRSPQPGSRHGGPVGGERDGRSRM